MLSVEVDTAVEIVIALVVLLGREEGRKKVRSCSSDAMCMMSGLSAGLFLAAKMP